MAIGPREGVLLGEFGARRCPQGPIGRTCATAPRRGADVLLSLSSLSSVPHHQQLPVKLCVAALSSGERPRAGEPTDSSSCDVIRPVPAALRLRHVMRPFGIAEEFYDKFTEAYGIPVVGKSTLWSVQKIASNISSDACRGHGTVCVHPFALRLH